MPAEQIVSMRTSLYALMALMDHADKGRLPGVPESVSRRDLMLCLCFYFDAPGAIDTDPWLKGTAACVGASRFDNAAVKSWENCFKDNRSWISFGRNHGNESPVESYRELWEAAVAHRDEDSLALSRSLLYEVARNNACRRSVVEVIGEVATAPTRAQADDALRRLGETLLELQQAGSLASRLVTPSGDAGASDMQVVVHRLSVLQRHIHDEGALQELLAICRKLTAVHGEDEPLNDSGAAGARVVGAAHAEPRITYGALYDSVCAATLFGGPAADARELLAELLPASLAEALLSACPLDDLLGGRLPREARLAALDALTSDQGYALRGVTNRCRALLRTVDEAALTTRLAPLFDQTTRWEDVRHAWRRYLTGATDRTLAFLLVVALVGEPGCRIVSNTLDMSHVS